MVEACWNVNKEGTGTKLGVIRGSVWWVIRQAWDATRVEWYALSRGASWWVMKAGLGPGLTKIVNNYHESGITRRLGSWSSFVWTHLQINVNKSRSRQLDQESIQRLKTDHLAYNKRGSRHLYAPSSYFVSLVKFIVTTFNQKNSFFFLAQLVRNGPVSQNITGSTLIANVKDPISGRSVGTSVSAK